MTEPGSIRRAEIRQALVRLVVIGLLLAALDGIRHTQPILMGSLTNPHTGLQIYYPACWRRAQCDRLSCYAAERKDTMSALQSGPTGLTVRFLSIPMGIWCRCESEPELADGETQAYSRLVERVAAYHGLCSSDVTTLSLTTLLKGPALLLTGPRVDGSWGSVAFRAEDGYLLLFFAAAPDRETFLRFRRTWGRMIRRARRIAPARPFLWLPVSPCEPEP